MSFNIPNIFLAGTKAIASDVNENFNAIKDEINLQKDNFANLKDNFESVSDYVNGDMREELVNLIKACHALFCINSGHTDTEGNADLLAIDTINENRIVFKIGEGADNSLEPISFSNAYGERATRTQLTPIEMTGFGDGEYIVCVKTSGSPYAIKGKLYTSKKEPEMNSGDIWFDTSKIPFKAWQHNGISKQKFEDVPAGSAIIKNEKLTEVQTFPYNQNGFDINTETAIKSGTNLVQSIIHYSKPNYNSIAEKQLDTQYTADKDGYLAVQTSMGGQESAGLKIGNLTLNYTTTNSYDKQGFVYPIAKGTPYMGTGKMTLYFMPHIS